MSIKSVAMHVLYTALALVVINNVGPLRTLTQTQFLPTAG